MNDAYETAGPIDRDVDLETKKIDKSEDRLTNHGEYLAIVRSPQQ